ncbi:leucine-rich repeat-containing G-protein coupled receptor 5 isoform X2 [Anolis carolinensis]|uniref:leucine-rich repeat-containing G-protein coupled receptor 5 isoform X2 n=1 Tax=Anolis carolinensis TaxID=28377 RepID=UPI002F2B7829
MPVSLSRRAAFLPRGTMLLLALLGFLGSGRLPSPALAGGGGWSGKRPRSCPAACHCEPDATLWRADCADRGLDGVPANLSLFTSYLDLSMNNISKLPSNVLHNLRFLEELRLAGNCLTHIPRGAFAGLFNLKVLMLQNNLLKQVPLEALQNLRSLQSLRLDANHISFVPPNSFSGLVSLRHLWLDDNALTEIPVQAFRSLPALQAMTLALNKIHHIPDYAFGNLSSLVVLHLHNNRIYSLGKKCFDGLHSLETLDLNYNNLNEFPISVRALRNLKELTFHNNNIRSIPEQAFVGNPSLIAIHFYDNPIQIVGKTAFQHLPELRTLTLNGASQITEFPDLTGTTSLESLTLTGAQITSLPETVCDQLPNLQVLDLSYNRLEDLPHFTACKKLQKINLHHNEIYEVQVDTFQQLAFLRSLMIEMPYPYQCCAFGACDSYYRIQNQWNKDENNSADEFQMKDAVIFHAHDDHDFEDFLLDFDEDLKVHHSVQCTPSPGPFKPCDFLFGSWLIRLGVWTIVVLAFICNALVVATVFRFSLFTSSIKLLIGLIAIVNALMGVSSSVLAVVDALTFGVFAKYGAWWEDGVGCHVVGILSIFASEASIFLLTLAALERGFSVKHATKFEIKPTLASIRIAIVFCFVLALIIAVIPILVGSEYGVSPLCIPLPFGKPTDVGYMVALVLLNSLCFLVMTIAYTKLYCSLEKRELDNIVDCSMVKHIALLLFTNCILYCPVAILSFSSLLNLTFISPEIMKPILLVIVPLPACLNPLLYILFNPHFKEDLGSLRKQTFAWKSKHASLVSVNSEDAEKQSCDSTQALVTFASNRISYDIASNNLLVPASYQMSESCNLSSVTFVPCR